MAGVWDFGNADDIQPLEDSSDEEGSEHGSYDELSLLPANKRRKLQKLNRTHKKVELIDLDDEDRDIDGNGSHGLYNAAKTTAKKALNTESDSDFDLEYRPPVKRQLPASTPLDPVILQNQALLRSFKEAAQEPLMDDYSPERAAPITPRRTLAQPEPQPQTDTESDSGSNDGESVPEVEDDDKVVLTMQSKEGKLQLRIGRQVGLKKLFDIYKEQAVKKEWLPAAKTSSVRFVWDGDQLTGTETAEDIDCDNGDIIEVKW